MASRVRIRSQNPGRGETETPRFDTPDCKAITSGVLGRCCALLDLLASPPDPVSLKDISDRPGLQGPVKSDYHLGNVRQSQDHALAFLDSEGAQGIGEAVGFALQIAIADLLTFEY